MRSVLLAACTLSVAALAACGGGSSGTSSTASTTVGATGSTARVQSVSAARKVPQSDNPYTLFEALQTRPLALSPSGQFLFAANTPDNRLEIFHVSAAGLQHVASVEVGLEPIAVAARSDHEVWVVNHLSDDISIVRVEGASARVVRTLLVGDEPRDIVFAGCDHDRAFVTTAHRGQNSPDDPDLFTPGVGRADVWVFDANNLGAAPGGQRLAKLTLFADTPRALAVTPDGGTVYAAAFMSGNQTTTVSETAVAQVYPNGMPGPSTIGFFGQTIPQPPTGLIVKYEAGPDGTFHWFDAYGANFDAFVKITLPDQDVFAIDANANPPVASRAFAHVGTTLFNMAVNPQSGKVYVSNTDAHNELRYEGHTPGFTSVAGDEVDSRVSVVDPASGRVTADNLNQHLTHAPLGGTGTGDPSLSMAFPMDLQVTRDGKALYVVAQGSSKLGIYDTASIESGANVASAANQVALTGGGPAGVVLDEALGMAFVLTRFDDGISVVNMGAKTEASHLTMYNPEPASVTAGRQYLYDATHTSALGDQACASCHIGGDFDGLAWDLGNPGFFPLPITTNYASEADVFAIPKEVIEALLGPQIAGVFAAYQPVKGPMTTQSLRGLDNHGPMHWRGDRNGAVQQNGSPFLDPSGNPVVSAQPNSGIFDERNAFNSFNVAFPGLVGNGSQLSTGDMNAFTDFALQIAYPPNPIRNLDDSLTADQQAGKDFFFHNANGTELPVDRFHNCNGCHVLDRNGNLGATRHPGFFGTDGRLSFENESQIFKVPHLRNAYEKIGMYASSPDSVHAIGSLVPPLNEPSAAVRGFGFQHDGATATLDNFLTAFVFIQTTVPVTFGGADVPPNPYGIPLFNDPADPLNPASGVSMQGVQLRRQIASYVFAFDTNLFPVVGQQITVTAADVSAAASRIALFEAQAAAGACDLVVRGWIDDRDAGFAYSGGLFVPDVAGPSLSDAGLRALLGDDVRALTFMCVPPGSGWRIGVDRDGDGYADGDELAAGSNPADPNSIP